MHPHHRLPGRSPAGNQQFKEDAGWIASRIQQSIDDINNGLIDATTVGRLHNAMALACAYAQGDPYAAGESR